MEVSQPAIDDVTRYDARLRAQARERAAESGDVELARLLRSISDRRARRSPGSLDVGPLTEGRSREPADHGSDAVEEPDTALQQPSAEVATGAEPGRILGVDHLGPSVRVFRVGRPAGLAFEAGQYLRLGVAGGKQTKFSIASAPHDPALELAVELRPGGRVTPALFALGPGDAVDLGDRVKGGLRLDAGAAHHLMVATVTGIAPLRSMVRDALHRGTRARFTILLGASNAAELPFHDELTALAASDERITYVPTVSRPAEAANRDWRGATGRVDPLAIQTATTLDPQTTRVYAVGNAGMIANVRAALEPNRFGVSTESYGA